MTKSRFFSRALSFTNRFAASTQLWRWTDTRVNPPNRAPIRCCWRCAKRRCAISPCCSPTPRRAPRRRRRRRDRRARCWSCLRSTCVLSLFFECLIVSWSARARRSVIWTCRVISFKFAFLSSFTLLIALDRLLSASHHRCRRCAVVVGPHRSAATIAPSFRCVSRAPSSL